MQLGIRLESSRGTISKQYSVRMLPDAARERSAAAKQEMRRDHLAAIKHFQLRAVAGSNAASDAQPPSSMPILSSHLSISPPACLLHVIELIARTMFKHRAPFAKY